MIGKQRRARVSQLRQDMAVASGETDENLQARPTATFGAAPALRREITTLIRAACARELSGRIAPLGSAL
jgi:hypothetical protein